MSNIKGSFTFVLHSHLPYVLSHGRWPHGMDWLNEASAETYIPLLNVFYDLLNEGIKANVVVGITPVLAEQLADETFRDEFKNYLENKIRAAENDKMQLESYDNNNMVSLADMWKNFYKGILDDFKNKYKENIIEAFRNLQDKGAIEIITCAATHGYLPLLGSDRSVEMQVKTGVECYKKHFNKQPEGIWLPECAYRPRYKWSYPIEGFGNGKVRKGIEEVLNENKIKYFIIDSHLLEGGQPIGVYLDRFKALKQLWGQYEKEYEHKVKLKEKHTPYNPYFVSSSESDKIAAVFTRDPKTGVQVWSGEHGYPGDGNYLDFHKKRFPGGLRYWKITGAKIDLGEKQIYNPDAVEQRINENAEHFKDIIKEQLQEHNKETGNKGIVVAPYDTELFGHWWFEGPRWLYKVIKLLDKDKEVELNTCGGYLKDNVPQEVISIPEGSWGEGGFHWIWFNDWTKWTWKHIYEAEKQMEIVSNEYQDSNDDDVKRLLKQLHKELLLLQSSDWQFLISTWSARDYAELRVSEHYNNFMRILDILKIKTSTGSMQEGDLKFLEDCEKRDCLFNNIEIKW